MFRILLKATKSTKFTTPTLQRKNLSTMIQVGPKDYLSKKEIVRITFFSDLARIQTTKAPKPLTLSGSNWYFSTNPPTHEDIDVMVNQPYYKNLLDFCQRESSDSFPKT